MGLKEEIKQRLDDPRVSAETKKQLLQDYADLGASDGELAPYEKQLGVDVTGGGGGLLSTVGAVAHSGMDLAKAQSEQLGQSWDNLNDSTPSPNSDALIDDGIVGLQIFDEFYPRYTKAGGDPGGVPAGGDVGTAALDPNSLRAAADELRGIDFTAFSADASAVDAVAKGVDDSRNHLAQAWANNLSGWTGGAAQAANQYKAKFDGAVATLDEGIKPIPGAITTASSTIQTQVTDYAKHLHNQWGDGKMAGLTPTEVDAMLEAKEKLPGAIAEMDRAIDKLSHRNLLEKALDFAFDITGMSFLGDLVSLGIGFAKNITKDNIREERDKYAQALSSAQEKLQQFVQDYGTKAAAVHDYSQQTYQAVQESYDALFQATTGQGKLSADPFAQLGTAPDFEDADKQGGGKKEHHPGNGRSSDHGRDQPESPPQNTGPPQQESPPQTQGHPQQTDPSGQHDPSQTDPTHQGTGDGTNKPPDAAIGQPETVEIKDGDRTISVTSPDGQGHVKVTVDDGSGKPKTYDLDFGAPTNPSQTGTPGTLDGLHGQEQQPGTNLPVVDPATGQPVTDPATGQPATPVHAGEDGKCVIQDGQLTITAEHPPGSPDTVKVTIDDGSGKPTTYTLDYSESGNPTMSQGSHTTGPIADKPMWQEPVMSGESGAVPLSGHTSGTLEGHGEMWHPDLERDLPPMPGPPVMEGTPEAAALLAGTDPQDTAAASSASAGSDYAAGGSGFGDSATGGPAGSFGAPDTGMESGQHAAGSGEAGLAAATDSGTTSADPVSGQDHGQSGAAGSGMPMMGGMGAGGGGGGDQDRAIGQWRTVGDLFDDDVPDAEASLGRVTSDERGYRG